MASNDSNAAACEICEGDDFGNVSVVHSDCLAALRAENESLRKRDSELWADAQRKIDTLKQQRRELRGELEGYKTGNYDLHAENQALRADLDEWREAASEFEQERDGYWTQIQRMRPIVEAACAFHPPSRGEGYYNTIALRRAVDAYQKDMTNEGSVDNPPTSTDQ